MRCTVFLWVVCSAVVLVNPCCACSTNWNMTSCTPFVVENDTKITEANGFSMSRSFREIRLLCRNDWLETVARAVLGEFVCIGIHVDRWCVAVNTVVHGCLRLVTNVSEDMDALELGMVRVASKEDLEE